MRILLTGCTGRIGFNLTKLLLEQGNEVYGIRHLSPCKIVHSKHYCLEYDILKSNRKIPVTLDKIDVLVHTAWCTQPSTYRNSAENREWVNSSKQLISEFKDLGGRYVVVLGSCAEYNWESLGTLDEEADEHPNSIYGQSKLELLNWLRELDFPFLWTRTFFQYGRDDQSSKFIPSIIDAILSNQVFRVHAKYDRRDFILDFDVAMVVGRLISLQVLGVVNVGTGSGTSMNSVVEKVAQLLNGSNLILFERDYSQFPSVISNNSKLMSILGDYQWKSIDETIEIMVLEKQSG